MSIALQTDQLVLAALFRYLDQALVLERHHPYRYKQVRLVSTLHTHMYKL